MVHRRADVMSGDLGGDAEATGMVVGAPVVLIGEGEHVEALLGQVTHQRVGEPGGARHLHIEDDPPRIPRPVGQQHDLARGGKDLGIQISPVLLPHLDG
jgi:hypothetical protein